MAGQKGRDVLLKVGDGAGGFVTLAGIRTKTFSLRAGAVDGTSVDSPDAWRELIAGAGVKTARISGSGVFKDAASDERMRAIFFAGTVADWQFVVADYGTLSGAFLITELTYGGDHDGEAVFSVTLESAGALTFAGQS